MVSSTRASTTLEAPIKQFKHAQAVTSSAPVKTMYPELASISIMYRQSRCNKLRSVVAAVAKNKAKYTK